MYRVGGGIERATSSTVVITHWLRHHRSRLIRAAVDGALRVSWFVSRPVECAMDLINNK